MSRIRLFSGPMFSGKSTALIADIERRLIGKQQLGKDFFVGNFYQDTRYGERIIASHGAQKVTATPLRDSQELLATLCQRRAGRLQPRPEYRLLKALYIDEAQFFDRELAAVVRTLDQFYMQLPNRPPLEILIAGLDLDFRGEPFGPMPHLLALADHVTKYVAVCTICGENKANRTQRLINGQAANYHDPIIFIGAEESYTARCQEHHEVPGRPELSETARPKAKRRRRSAAA